MSDKDKPKRESSKVSRSAFVKCDEKRKALLREIYILTSEKYFLSFERLQVVEKYRKLQHQDDWLIDFLKEQGKTK